MSTFTSFAVVGAGELGNSIIEGLKAKENISLVVLTRSLSSKSALSLPPGSQVEEVDFRNVAALTAVLKKHKVEAVISTVGPWGLDSQKTLADASVAARTVKLFIPSDFGIRSLSAMGMPKEDVAAYITSTGIPTLRIFTGPFDSWVAWFASLDLNGKVNVIGKGEATFGITHVPDIGGFVAHVLTSLKPSELQNQIFRIEGDRLSLIQLAELHKTEVQQLDLTVRAKDNVEAFKRRLLLWVEEGADSYDAIEEGGGVGGSANRLWPNHQWKTYKEALKL